MADDGWKLQVVQIMNKLRPFILRIGGGGDDGEELWEEVIIACLDHPEYEWKDPRVEGCVRRIAENLKISRHRQTHHHVALNNDIADRAVDQISFADLLELFGTVLNADEIQVLVRHAVQGIRLNEIARERGITPGAMRVQWLRLRQRLLAYESIRALST